MGYAWGGLLVGEPKSQPQTGHTREPDPTHNELKHTIITRKTSRRGGSTNRPSARQGGVLAARSDGRPPRYRDGRRNNVKLIYIYSYRLGSYIVLGARDEQKVPTKR